MNAGHIKQMTLARQLYGENLGTLTDNLIPMGDSKPQPMNWHGIAPWSALI